MQFLIQLLAILFSATSCPEHFWKGQEPSFTQPTLQVKRDQVLCYREFALSHSGQYLTAIWVAEHLTGEKISRARTLQRVNDFHEESRLPEKFRSWMRDYRNSGFDRGHLAPSADMSTMEAQQESFSLANMVPQDRELNRGVWERIERSVRHLASTHGEAYVVTGPLFQGQPQQAGRVRVPSHLWKLVIIPSKNAGAAYLCENKDTDSYEEISIAQLEALTGIQFGLGSIASLSLPRPTKGKAKGWF